MPYIEQEAIRNKKYTTGGGTTAYTLTIPNTPALYDGLTVTVKMNATNTGSSTLNINGLGAKTLKKPGVTNLSSGDLLINSVYTFVYDLSQDFFFLPSLSTTTNTNVNGFGGGVSGAYGLVDYIFSRAGNSAAGYLNKYGLYESANYVYAASFVAFDNGSNDDAVGVASLIRIDKTTLENTVFRSNCIGVNYSGASPDTYITEDAGVIYFGFDTSGTQDRYIGFDTATDTFGSYGATTLPGITNIIIGNANPSLIYIPGTSGIAPGTSLPAALSYGGYEYSFNQKTSTETGSSRTGGAAITFLTRTGSIYEYNNIGIEINDITNTSMLAGQFFFKPDGTKFYVQNGNSNLIEYALSTPWDLSTYSYTTVEITGVRRGNFWKADGLFQYAVLGQGTDRVYRNVVGSAWDVTSFGAQTSYNPSAQCADVSGVWLNDTGTKMYLLDGPADTGFGGTNKLYQYSLSTPRQISAGVTYDTVLFDFSNQDSSIQAVAFSTDGTKMFACGSSTQTVYQYELSVAWDVSTATYGGNAFKNISSSAVIGVGFRPDMSYMYVANNFNTAGGTGNNLLEYIQI